MGSSDLTSYRKMIMEVAETVAGTSREIGFTGVGGGRGRIVSDREVSMLTEIKHAIGA